MRYVTRPGKQLQVDFWGGIPEQVLVDNTMALITLNNPRTGELVVNPALAHHWGFTVKACWPQRPLALGKDTAATVLSGGDGDTLRVCDGPQRLTIRRACIDALETAQSPMCPLPVSTCRSWPHSV